MNIRIKRIYDESEKSDGCRILVDRIWPRGIAKEAAKIDHWAKDIAPSNELRKWFDHDPEKWEAFKQKFFEELRDNNDQLEKLKSALKKHTTTTLLYSARDTTHNNAAALKEYLETEIGKTN